ncbi:endoglucanase-1 precursor [Aureobasidium pullulans]|uniref:Endoglucanase-1 n=1 Tax=Aureobasidium pullulans TaxID=5580 RepID=A0A4S9TIX2_AURPU|nr:endoglucanase-1 precursor [Aureobasidium pullulans]THZ24057.1 endoglucanase-1 precursor [Aureobasidium pullulans]
MSSFFAKALTLGALAAPMMVSAAPSSMVKKSQIITTSAKQAAVDLCGTADNLVLYDTPWIVYNMFYGAASSVGTQCTRYDHVVTPSTGNKEIVWSAETNIQYVKATDNVPKGYAFVGLTQNLETTISGISSIPTTYTWTRTNTTAFKGNVCYDFMTSNTKGDSTTSNAQELMLWLQYEGGQLPIGWAAGAKATINNLFGTSWKLYEGKNDDTGITVHTMMPEKQFEGSFSGDLKLWLEALVQHGTFKDSTYVNVGNAGTEYFYGNSNLNATLGLQINLN